MDLREALIAEHSKDQAQRICDWVGDDSEKFAELIKLMTGPVYRISQRASWPVSLCLDRNPEFVKPYFSTFIKLIEKEDVHPAVRRNILRLLQFVEIPERYHSRLFDACCLLVAEVLNPAAIRAFSLTVAANLAKDQPDLLSELKSVAAQHPSASTAALRVRLRRIFGEVKDG